MAWVINETLSEPCMCIWGMFQIKNVHGDLKRLLQSEKVVIINRKDN